ncbi:MAG TPA: hypothetical protein VL242_53205, partial [Sorangium sp.]|nr:hypothetical protein [Sorangium sp.]
MPSRSAPERPPAEAPQELPPPELAPVPPAVASLPPELAPVPLEAALDPESAPQEPVAPMKLAVDDQCGGQVWPVELSLAQTGGGPQRRSSVMSGENVLPPSVETPAVKPSTGSSAQAKR